MKEEPKRQKPPDFANIRARYPRAYKSWDDKEDQRLREETAAGKSLYEISKRHKRQQSAVKSRIKHLENP